MTGPTLLVEGRPLRLGKRVGKGGEGEVFALADRPDEAVKVYCAPDARREAKIAAMIAAGLASTSRLVAFPVAMARGPGNRFAGFTMRLVTGHSPLFELYSPGARKVAFPKADYRFLVRSAANIAVAVAKVHEAGAVVGDINHSGILISDKAVAALIDADSFQFGARHLCRVGVPEYTPPELQGVRLDGVVRTPAHDAFGLAVIVFQLLFMGRHPFSGRFAGGEMPIERGIGEHRFAYSAQSDTGMTPPPGTARLSDLPNEIGAMFEAAFGRSGVARPTPAQWAPALIRLEQSLSKCPADPMHFFPSAAGACVWCRMERASGVVLFVPPLLPGTQAPVSDPGAAGFDLRSVWAAIQAVRLPPVDDAAPPLTSTAPTASAGALGIASGRRARRIGGLLAMLVAAVLLGLNPGLWLIWAPLAWFGWHLTFGKPPNAQPLVEQYRRADAAYATALDGWRKRVGLVELAQRRRELEEAKAAYERLPGEEKRKLGELTSKRRNNQLRRYLDGFQIRGANIRGIGPGKIAALASYGIDTAAEVRHADVLAIPGFGPVNSQPLFDWRAKLEARFVYNPNPTPQDRQDEDRIRQETVATASKLRRTLVGGVAELRTAAATAEQRLRSPDPAVDKAQADREQARVDLETLGLPLPKPVPTARSPAGGGFAALNRVTQPIPTAPTTPATGPRCPRCGGAMVRRTAHRGARAGRPFLGCARYPRCRGTRSI